MADPSLVEMAVAALETATAALEIDDEDARAEDEWPTALDMALLDEDEGNCSDLECLCAYIGADPLAPVRS